MRRAGTPERADIVAEVAIVGGGPAGLSTALFLLAERPDLAGRVVVLEKSRYPRDKICGGAIGARADRRLASIGVHVDVPSVAIDGMRLTVAEGSVTRSLGGIGRVVRRIEFDAALMNEARRRGARVLEDMRVTAIERTASGAALSTPRGSVVASVVVGADGVGSVVRRALGLPFGRLTAQVVEVDTELAPGDPAPDHLHFDLGDRGVDGYAWDFATPLDGAIKVCRGVYSLRTEGGVGPDVADLLDARLARQGARAIGEAKRFSERGFDLHHAYSQPHVLLVGEAAGIDPVTGEGIAQAIEYGAVAARYLAVRLRAGALDFRDWTAHLRRTTLGMDLALRTVSLPVWRGRLRPSLERYLVATPWAIDLTMSAFAGRRPPVSSTVRAAGRALRHLVTEVRR